MIITPQSGPQFVEPLIYLAGPISGARDWQATAVVIIQTVDPEVNIANPRCSNFPGNFDAQINWEQYHLDRAQCILFWFAREAFHRHDRAYAHAARFELGERLNRLESSTGNVVVGIEQGFTGEHYLYRRLSTDYRSTPVRHTLRQACVAAVEKARGRQVTDMELLEESNE